MNNEEFEKTETIVGTLRQQEPVAWMCEANVFHTAQWKPALAFEKQDAECFRNWQPLYAKPQSCVEVCKNSGVLHTTPAHARPVVHAVRCTYPQCQATNGCVGACSKGQPDLARVGEVGIWGEEKNT